MLGTVFPSASMGRLDRWGGRPWSPAFGTQARLVSPASAAVVTANADSGETVTPRPIAPDTGLPYVLPPGWRDVTAERAGTMFAIVGAEHLRGAFASKAPAPSPAPPERK